MINLLHLAITFLMLMTLVTSSRNAKLVNVMENDRACINFPHSCDVYEVVLQAGYKPPFYHSRHGGILNLPPDQADRFFVENSNYTDSCSLNLTIFNVHKDDATIYTCSIYKDRESVEDYKRVGLHVDYPPGKASCQLQDKQDGDWSSIQCNASVGSLAGHIECYQNGEKMPSLKGPFETNTSLMQTIMINNSYIVFCCSSSFKKTKELCECNDSIIDPIYNRHLPSRDVCPATVAPKPEQSSTSKSPNASRNFVSTHTDVEVESTQHTSEASRMNRANVFWGCTVSILVCIILVMAVVFFLWKRKNNSPRSNQLYKAVKRQDQENEDKMDIELANLPRPTQLSPGNERETKATISSKQSDTPNEDCSSKES